MHAACTNLQEKNNTLIWHYLKKKNNTTQPKIKSICGSYKAPGTVGQVWWAAYVLSWCSVLQRAHSEHGEVGYFCILHLHLLLAALSDDVHHQTHANENKEDYAYNLDAKTIQV